MVLLHDTQVHEGLVRPGSPEEYVGDLGGETRAPPSVRKGGPKAVEEGIRIVCSDAHLDPVHRVDHFPVDPPRGDARLLPGLPRCRGCTFCYPEGVLHASEFLEHGRPELTGDLPVIFPGRLDPVFAGESPQLLRVRDRVIANRAFPDAVERQDDLSPVVRVGCCPRRELVEQVPCDYQVGIRPADTPDAVRRDDPARTHGTPLAGESCGTILALGLLHLVPVPDCLYPLLHRVLDEWLGSLVERPALPLLLDESRVHQGQACTVKLAHVDLFPDNLWFLLSCHGERDPFIFSRLHGWRSDPDAGSLRMPRRVGPATPSCRGGRCDEIVIIREIDPTC